MLQAPKDSCNIRAMRRQSSWPKMSAAGRPTSHLVGVHKQQGLLRTAHPLRRELTSYEIRIARAPNADVNARNRTT